MSKPHFSIKTLSLALLSVTSIGVTVPAYSDTFTEALTGGKPIVDMRLRYESVGDDDNTTKDASALTLRTRLGYQTADYKNFFALGEYEDVEIIGGMDNYFPEKTGYALIADPQVTQLNRAFIGYKGVPNTLLKLGRQRIIYDNARFIGNVGWRQNEQTFDAFTLKNTSIKNVTLNYAFIGYVNGILPKFDADVSDHLINLKYTGFKPAKVSLYSYLLKDDNTKKKTDTYGGRLAGKSGKLLYTAEYAQQSTDSNNASYYLLEGGAKLSGTTMKLGYEVLGSDGGNYGFQTPLATKHAFNGWADMFLKTPTTGLKDLNFKLARKIGGVKLVGVYHKYSADKGSTEYGSELNLLAVKKFSKNYVAGVKFAQYNADKYKTNTNKLWVWGQLKF